MGKVNSARLKALRKERKLIQDDVAKKIGIGRTGYVRIENGERDADTNTLTRLADFFNVSVDYLLGRTDNPEGIVIGDYTFTVVDPKANPADTQRAEVKRKVSDLLDSMPEEMQKAALAQLEALAALNKK